MQCKEHKKLKHSCYHSEIGLHAGASGIPDELNVLHVFPQGTSSSKKENQGKGDRTEEPVGAKAGHPTMCHLGILII